MNNMKLASRLEKQLGRLFLMGSATIVLVVASGFYVVQIERLPSGQMILFISGLASLFYIGFVVLHRSLKTFVQQILRLEARVKEAGIKEGRVEAADRVAHALKGKLAVLRLRIENMQGLSSEEKSKLRASVNGLILSSKDVLESGRTAMPVELPQVSVLDIVEHAVELRKEGERLNGRRERISVSVAGDRQNGVTIAAETAAGFEDAIIAIIDNALEASTEFVHVHCESSLFGNRIEITDFGCGIPEDVLPRLMKERATFGKHDGNGLGLFHAAKSVRGLGGTIEIHSKEGIGTTVAITIAALDRLKSPASRLQNSLVLELAN